MRGFFVGGGLSRAQNSLFSCGQIYHLMHKTYHQGSIYMLSSKAPDKFNVHKELILIIAAYCSSDLQLLAVDRFDLYI